MADEKTSILIQHGKDYEKMAMEAYAQMIQAHDPQNLTSAPPTLFVQSPDGVSCEQDKDAQVVKIDPKYLKDL